MKAIIESGEHEDRILFRPQMEMLCDEVGKIMIDFVGRYESFQSDFDSVCHQLNLATKELEHVNAIVRGEWKQYYDEELRALVVQKYHQDFKIFGHPTKP